MGAISDHFFPTTQFLVDTSQATCSLGKDMP